MYAAYNAVRGLVEAMSSTAFENIAWNPARLPPRSRKRLVNTIGSAILNPS
jgi:hypothetical protein